MPRLAGEDDAGSDIDDVFEDTVTEVDTEAEKQLNGELKGKVDEDEDDLAPGAPKDNDAKGARRKGKAEDDDDDGDDEENEASEYIVEIIRDHKFYKGQPLYLIKWQGYSDDDNTWEPEEHLLPHSRQILATYHKKVGGPPQPPIKRGKSKQSLREAASSEDLRSSKRQKRNGSKDSEEAGSWLPEGDQWEDQVNKVETIERSSETNQLMAYIQFKNGKRSKISMDMVYQHCPRPMLKFYEEHLKFN